MALNEIQIINIISGKTYLNWILPVINPNITRPNNANITKSGPVRTPIPIDTAAYSIGIAIMHFVANKKHIPNETYLNDINAATIDIAPTIVIDFPLQKYMGISKDSNIIPV